MTGLSMFFGIMGLFFGSYSITAQLARIARALEEKNKPQQ